VLLRDRSGDPVAPFVRAAARYKRRGPFVAVTSRLEAERFPIFGTADSPRVLKKFISSSWRACSSVAMPVVFFLILASRAFDEAIIIILLILHVYVCMYMCQSLKKRKGFLRRFLDLIFILLRESNKIADAIDFQSDFKTVKSLGDVFASVKSSAIWSIFAAIDQRRNRPRKSAFEQVLELTADQSPSPAPNPFPSPPPSGLSISALASPSISQLLFGGLAKVLRRKSATTIKSKSEIKTGLSFLSQERISSLSPLSRPCRTFLRDFNAPCSSPRATKGGCSLSSIR